IDVERRAKHRWIVEARGADRDHVRRRAGLAEQAATAIAAELATRDVPALGGRVVVARRAFRHAKAGARDAENRRVAASAFALAILAMAVHGDESRARGFIANGAARAAAGEVRLGHEASFEW